jgi:hypothetical protein
MGPRAGMPPGMQAARVAIAVSGLDSLLWRLAEHALHISRNTGRILFYVVTVPDHDLDELRVAVRMLGSEPRFRPVFRCTDPEFLASGEHEELRPIRPPTTRGDTVTADFRLTELRSWLTQYDQLGLLERPPVPLAVTLAGSHAGSRFLLARDVPIELTDMATGDLIEDVQTRP